MIRLMRLFIGTVLLSSLLSAQDPREFLPLRIGNYWEYEREEFPTAVWTEFIRVVGDTLMPNGNEYLIVNHRFPDGEFDEYIRVDDSATVYWYRTYDSVELILDKLGARLGEWWMSWKYAETEPVDSPVVYGLVADTGRVRSRATKLIKYYVGVPSPPGSGLELSNDYFTEGIGLTLREYEFGVQRLVGAIIDGDTLGIITSAPGNARALAGSFVLFQNFPNPFNSRTIVWYSGGDAELVEIAVYDVTGEKIAILFKGAIEAGVHRTTWDGTNFGGQLVSSGSYFIGLRTERFLRVRKAIYLR